MVRKILEGVYACLLEIRPGGWFRQGWEMPDLARIRRRPFLKRAEGIPSHECLSGVGLIPERTRGFRAIAHDPQRVRSASAGTPAPVQKGRAVL